MGTPVIIYPPHFRQDYEDFCQWREQHYGRRPSNFICELLTGEFLLHPERLPSPKYTGGYIRDYTCHYCGITSWARWGDGQPEWDTAILCAEVATGREASLVCGPNQERLQPAAMLAQPEHGYDAYFLIPRGQVYYSISVDVRFNTTFISSGVLGGRTNYIRYNQHAIYHMPFDTEIPKRWLPLVQLARSKPAHVTGKPMYIKLE